MEPRLFLRYLGRDRRLRIGLLQRNLPSLDESTRKYAFIDTCLESHITTVQGDPAPYSKPPVYINVKVAFKYKVLILKRNFKSMSTRGFEQAEWSPCTVVLLFLLTLKQKLRFQYMPLILRGNF